MVVMQVLLELLSSLIESMDSARFHPPHVRSDADAKPVPPFPPLPTEVMDPAESAGGSAIR